MLKQSSILAATLVAMLSAGAALANEDNPPKKAAAEADSAQPVNDTWITTKVKASLVAESNVPSMTIDVDTVNGVVFLTGTVQTKAQADEAKRLAAQVEGVAKVDDSRLKVAATAPGS